ncbi:hypothetical protein ACKWTF_002785 [Chironomus riparius]
MNWKLFFKNQFLIGIANSIPFTGIMILELFTEDRIINSYDMFLKEAWFPPKWVFSIIRSVVLSLIGYSTYRLWIIETTSKCSKKGVLAFIFYGILLLLDWSTIFLSPTKLDIAAYYYIGLISFALITSMIFKQIDKFGHYFFVPYIFWLTLMGILHYQLYVNNHDGKWFSNHEPLKSTNETQNVTFKLLNESFPGI